MGKILTIEMLDKIDQYLKGTLTESEQLDFEKLLNENVVLREEVNIQKQLFKIHNFETKAFSKIKENNKELFEYRDQLRNQENSDLSNKIREIGSSYIKEKSVSSKKKSHFKYYIAASIAIVFASWFLLNGNSNLDNYYTENVDWEKLPSFLDKGSDESSFTKGETFFKNKEYKKAISIFNTINEENQLHPFSLMYIGASYDKLNENEKALESFKKLSELKSFEEHSRGYWYSLLIYLKQNNKEKAKEMKAIILENENNYNYKKTVDLDF